MRRKGRMGEFTQPLCRTHCQKSYHDYFTHSRQGLFRSGQMNKVRCLPVAECLWRSDLQAATSPSFPAPLAPFSQPNSSLRPRSIHPTQSTIHPNPSSINLPWIETRLRGGESPRRFQSMANGRLLLAPGLEWFGLRTSGQDH